MAQQVSVQLVDDLDGGAADRSVEFALDGRDYEIDLSIKNDDALRDILRPYVDAARSVRQTRGTRLGQRTYGGSPRSRPATTQIDRLQAKAIRDWADARGLKVAPRGRIPTTIIQAYNNDHRAVRGQDARSDEEWKPPEPMAALINGADPVHVTRDAMDYYGGPPPEFADSKEWEREVRAWAKKTERKVGPRPSTLLKMDWSSLFGAPVIHADT